MTRIVWICYVVLKNRLCHRACNNLLLRRNIYVQILAWWNHWISAGAYISISVNVLSSWIWKHRWHLFFIFCSRPGISHLWRVTRAWPLQCHRTTASVASASLLVSNGCMYIRAFCMILISLLSDRNHTEDRLNVPANVPGWQDRNLNRLSIMDKRFLQVIFSSLFWT